MSCRYQTSALRASGGLVAAILALVAAGVGPMSTARAAPAVPPLVIHDVRTSSDLLPSYNPKAPEADYEQPDTQIEPSIAANPKDPRNVVTVFQEGRIDSGGDATNGFATSFDGGFTWAHGDLPGLTNVLGQGGPFDRASDAVVAFGPDGTVYANSLVFDIASDQGLRSGISVNVSRDGGLHWSAPVFLQDDLLGGTNDKNWIVVDQSDAPGHHKGRVYVVWDRVAPVVYDYCDHDCDQLANWLPNLQTIPGIVFPGQGIGAYPLVLADGSLGIVMDTAPGGIPQPPNGTDQPDIKPPLEIVLVKAPLAGLTAYPAPLVFIPPIDIGSNQSKTVPAQRAGGLPAAAVDPLTGALYAVWEDGRFRSDGTNDAVMSVSRDGGITWSGAKRINPGPANDHVDRYNIAVAVGSDGAVHVAYRQRVETGKAPVLPPAIDSYYQESYDGAQTFTPPLQLDSVPSNAYYGAFSRRGTFEGDYDQITSAGGYTYFTRCQGQPAYPGEPPALTPGASGAGSLQLADSGRGHQHQHDWVALMRNIPPPIPAPAAISAGAAGGVSGATSAAASTLPNTAAAPSQGRAAALAPAVLIGLSALRAGRRRRRD